MSEISRKILVMFMVLALVFTTVACTGEAKTPKEENKEEKVETQPEKKSESDKTEVEVGGEKVDTVKLGILLPFTGTNARIGQLQFNGMEFAINNFNEAGGVKSLGGAKIEIVKTDTTGAPEIGVTELEKLVTVHNVSALLGPYNSSVGSSTAPIAEKYKTPYILSNCTADEILLESYKYVYRANHSNSFDGIDLINFLKDLKETKEDASFTKFAVVYENTDWGKGMKDVLGKAIPEEYGGEVVLSEGYQSNTADFSSIITKIKASGAEVVIPVSYLNDALLFTQQMAEYKSEAIIFASSGGFTVPDYATKVGEAGNQVLTIASWDQSVLPFLSEEASKLTAQYKEIYNEDFDGYAANGYLAAAVMLNAIERAGSTDRDEINEALENTDIKPGEPELVFHPYSGIYFKDDVRGMTHQNSGARGIILQVNNGKFNLIGPADIVGEKSELIWPVVPYSDR